MFAIISNLLIFNEFTDYKYRFVTDKNYIYLVENDNAKDMDEDREFLWDPIEERYGWKFLFKMSTDLKVPELHINWKINIKSFKLILNILDKMKAKIYFFIDLECLLNKENDFEEILKEFNYRLNFKIYCGSIVYKFINKIKVKITNEQLKKFNEIYTQMISNEWNIFIINLKSINSWLLDKLLKTNEEILVDALNSEGKSNGKKKIIYYKQWQFIIDNDEGLEIIEGLSYAIYFDDWFFGTEISHNIPKYLSKYNNIFYGVNSRTCGEVNLYDEYYSLKKAYPYIDILVEWKIKEKWLLLAKYYSYLIHEYTFENSDIFEYQVEINDYSSIILLNPSKLYEKWGIDCFPDYSNEYFIKDTLNYKNYEVKNIWNIIDKIRKNENEGILLL